GGGVLTNHFGFYQEVSTVAQHEYGAYYSAPVGIGNTAPTYLLDVLPNAPNLALANWLRVGNGNGTFFVTANGASFYPGYNPGPGGLGATNVVIGDGNAIALNATSYFLYLSSMAGTPTGVPAQAAAGRVPIVADTAGLKPWLYLSGAWRALATEA